MQEKKEKKGGNILSKSLKCLEKFEQFVYTEKFL